MLQGWDDEAQCSGRHWVGVSHNGTVRCLLRGDKSLGAPPDPLAAAGAVLAYVMRVYAVWYAVMPALGSPQPPPNHRDPRVVNDPNARERLAARALVEAWRQRRRVQVVFHAP